MTPKIININQKTITSRLLANENITVEFGNFQTAYFDIKNRMLGMPLWALTDPDKTNMFIGHEVSHALHTPPQEWEHACKLSNCPKMLLNVIEDIRIEKLIIKKYPGLLMDFIKAYKILLNENFFGIKGKAIKKLGFMDRLNIKSKLRDNISLDFAENEQYYVNLAYSCESFEDVVQASIEIYKWLPPPDPDPGTAKKKITKKKPEDSEEENKETIISDDSVDTMVAADAYAKKQYRSRDLQGVMVLRTPNSKDIESMIYKYEHLERLSKTPKNKTVYGEFKKTIEPAVSLMIKEFEMRKSATRTKRGRISPKGSIDTNKLYRYKYDENIFKQVMTVEDTKSHGMIMAVDISMSMTNTITDVIKQTLILCEFCRRINIPFEVWFFTSLHYSVNSFDLISHRTGYHIMPHLSFKGVYVAQAIRSDLSRNDYEKAARIMFGFGEKMSGTFKPLNALMGGTPLLESMIIMIDRIKIFQRDKKLEKVTLIALTDGEGDQIKAHIPKTKTTPSSASKACRYFLDIGGDMIALSDHSQFLNTIFYYIKRNVCNVINIHISNNLTSNIVGNYTNTDTRDFTNNGLLVFENPDGANRTIIIQQKKLNTEIPEMSLTSGDDFDIAQAFKQVNKDKKNARIIAQKINEIFA